MFFVLLGSDSFIICFLYLMFWKLSGNLLGKKADYSDNQLLLVILVICLLCFRGGISALFALALSLCLL